MDNIQLQSLDIIALNELNIQRNTFLCGVAALDNYFYKYVSQDVKRGLAKCFVLIDKKQSMIIGYYTLSALSISVSDIPKENIKNKIRYPLVPVALMGRLAVDHRYAKQGFGKFLIVDAIHKVKSSNLGTAALVVDAKDDKAVLFYEKLGFIRFLDYSNGKNIRLFYPLTGLMM